MPSTDPERPLPAVGDRIRLVLWGPSELVDDNLNVPPGTEGTVTGVHPNVDQLWIRWDNGSTLNPSISYDAWEPV